MAVQVVIYHKSISAPGVRFSLPAHAGRAPEGAPASVHRSASQPFISSLCWRPADRNLLAASSSGSVCVLQLLHTGAA